MFRRDVLLEEVGSFEEFRAGFASELPFGFLLDVRGRESSDLPAVREEKRKKRSSVPILLERGEYK